MAAGYHLTLALMSDGTVKGWGGNSFGQLGDGLRVDATTPVSPVGLSGVAAIAAAGAHAMALLKDGTVMTWGGNRFGELGIGTNGFTASLVPVHVPNLNGVVAIAAGGADDVALLNNGTLMAWGENKNGQLGDGTTVEKDVPTRVPGLSGVTAVSTGGLSSVTGHTLALLSNGTVMAWGANGSGQLGNGSTSNHATPTPGPVKGLSSVTAISAGVGQSLALLSDGTVRTWGSNYYGQLGVGPGLETCGVSASACSRTPIPVGGLRNVTAVSGGFGYSLALSEGKAFAWGWDRWGQLGDGTLINSSVPVAASGLSEVTGVAAGEQHSLALLGGVLLPPPVTLTPAVHALTVAWVAPEGTERWQIRWRPLTNPPTPTWSPYVYPPPAARSYTISGLGVRPYQVLVKNNAFGAKFVVGSPLGAVVGTPLEGIIPAPVDEPAEPSAPEGE
jgi:alpha-tubulin suppressor-like RCC1 family protein